MLKWALLGGGIALALISLFLFSAGEGDPSWPRFWYIRPLIIVPLAGATGGVFNYFINRMLNQGTAQKIAAVVIGLIVYVVGLWLGTVLGLDGTMWN